MTMPWNDPATDVTGKDYPVNIDAQQSLSPSLITEYGPAWVLTPMEWMNYLMSTGELDPSTPPEVIADWIKGVDTGILPRPRTRYEAGMDEVEAAFALSQPGQNLYDYVSIHFPGGTMPEGFAAQWGLTPSPVAGTPAAPEWVGPPTPGFLTTDDLTGLEIGQPLEARATKFASGQTMRKLAPSQREGLGGFINWSAGQVSGAPASYDDWLYGSQQLLPQKRQTVRWGSDPYRA